MELQERTVWARSAYTPTKETELQINRSLRKVRTTVMVCIGCGMIIMSQLFRIGLTVLRVIIFKQPIYSAVSLWTGIAGILLAVLLLVWSLIGPRRAAGRRMRQYAEAYETVPTRVVEFTPDGISIRSDGEAAMGFAYSAIRKCVETADLFIFMTKEKQLFAIEKQRLELTDLEGFRGGLCKTCLKARLRLRKAK